MEPSWSIDELVAHWGELLREVVNDAEVNPSRVVGIGAGLPGVVSRDGFRTRAYLPPGRWVDLDATPAFERAGVPVRAANNVLCVSEYEHRLGAAQGESNFISILIRYGLGAALYGHGAFLVGEESFTGEFGHMRIHRDGPPCSCGRTGCLDAFVSGRTLPDLARMSGAERDAELRRRMESLATGAANLLKVFHPPLIILNGLYNEHEATVAPVLAQALERELSQLGLATPRIAFGAEVEFKASIGAALRAGDALLPDYLLKRIFRRAAPGGAGSRGEAHVV